MRTMPRRLVTAALGAAVVALALPTVAPQTTAQSADRRPPRSETLHLVLRNGTQTDVDVSDVGFGPGDYNLKIDEVFQGGNLIGQSTQQCILMRVDPEPNPDALLHCTINLMLAKGEVTVQGSFSLVDYPPTLAVTAGTGRYLGVWGELAETEGDGDSTTMDLRLYYPRR